MLEGVRVDRHREAEEAVPEIDVSRPHEARMYDYLLGRCFL